MLVRDGATAGAAFDLDSPTGTHAVEALGDGRYRIAIGVPRFEPSAIGLMGFDAAREEYDIALDEDTRLRFGAVSRSDEHTSELQALMSISYAAFCLNQKHNTSTAYTHPNRF